MTSGTWMLFACSEEADIPPTANAGSTASGVGGSGMGGSGGTGTMDTPMGGGAGTTTMQGGSGGTPAVPFTPVVLFEFDPGVVGTYGWAPEPSIGGSLELVNEDRDPTHTPAGALRFTAVFPAYDAVGASSSVSAAHVFGDPNTATSKALVGGTRVHFWIRLAAPAGAPPSLAFFQPFIQGGGATAYSSNYGFATGEAVADNLWHEFTLEVAGQTFMNDVWRVGLQVVPAAAPSSADAGVAPSSDAGADAGISAPASITFDIDHVWVE